MQRQSAAAQLVQAGVLLVLTFTLMEPASAVGLVWWQRAVFYAAHVAPAMAVAWAASGWLFNRPGLTHWPAWLLLVLAGAMAGVVLAPWSVLLELSLGVVDLDEPGPQPTALGLAAWWSELGDELWQVPPRTALFWLVMNLWVIWRAQQPQGLRPAPPALPGPRARAASADTAPPCAGFLPAPATASAPAPAASSAPAPSPAPAAAPTPAAAPAPAAVPASTPSVAAVALLDRLPARLGRDLVQLEAQQHYLRVVTTRGEHLLLHGLAPAVAELARHGIAGMQIHRSLWVAWAHVERLDMRPASPAAVLRDGRRLPIGRRRLRAVAQAWQQWPGN